MSSFDDKLRKVASGVELVDKVVLRNQITRIFRDEALKLKLDTVSILRGNLNILTNLMVVATGMSDAMVSEEGREAMLEEFKDEDLAIQVKMLRDITDTMMRLSASSSQIDSMIHAFNELEKSLATDMGDTEKRKKLKSVFDMVQSVVMDNEIEEAEVIDVKSS